MTAAGRRSVAAAMRARGLVRRGHVVLVAAGALLVAWFLVLSPAFLGGPATYVRVSGDSMEPALHAGDLVVARAQSSYGPGEVVAFRPPRHNSGQSAVVLHRIVGGSAEDGFITQGDNNKARDPWRLSQRDMLGEMWFSVPAAGRLLAFLQSPLLSAGLASGFAVFLLLSGGTEEKRPRRASRSKHRDGTRRPWRPPGLTLWLLLAGVALMVRR